MRYSIYLSLAIGATPLAAQVPSVAKLDSIFSGYRRTDGPGCSVAVSKAGETLVARGYGMADLAQGIAISPQSVFHVASVSKEFTGMALVLLAQSGKISLDDEVRKYIPELPAYEKPITIRHILTHTSGLRDQWSLLMTAGWRLGDDLITEQDVLDIVTRQKGLNFAPGSFWNYSNTGFSLAAILVKRVTGKTIRQYAEEVMFKPMGMRQTHFHDDNNMVVPMRTRGFTYRDGEWKESVPNYSTVGATSLFTTVSDLVQWHKELDEGTVGGRAAVDVLLKQGVLTSGDTLQYALGISRGTYRGLPVYSHSGGDPGYRAYLLHFPTLKAGVSVLCNLNEVNPVRLTEQTADLYFGSDLGPAKQLGDSLAGGALVNAPGLYWSEATEGWGKVAVASGVLGWQGGGPTPTPLRRLTDRTYSMGGGTTTVTVEPDGRLKLTSGNGESSWFAKVEPWTPGPADRAGLAGRYASDEIGVTWELRVKGDSVELVRPKFPSTALRPIFKDTYQTTAGLGFTIRAKRDKAGAVTAITVGSGRVVAMPFVRVDRMAGR